MSRTAKDIFLDALDIADAGDRQRFIDGSTAGDDLLRRHVLALLAAHAGSPTFSPPKVDAPAARPPGGRPSTFAAGDVVDGRFTLVRPLGEGGFGVVWLARQTEPVERDVALKLLKGGLDSAQVVARFDAERQTLARMDHPHIARVFDAGTSENGSPYFVMEYVDGRPITAHCDAAGAPLNDRLELLRLVCLAVQHAHGKGVIHRDLKPGNILVSVVDGRAVPKVIDFGIAKAIAADDDPDANGPAITLEAQVIGTPQYMSPEQATIGPKSVDTRSDVYSLGTVLYELITGLPPFDPAELRRAGLEQICRIVRERTPSKPSTRLGEPQTGASTTATTSRTGELTRMRRQVSGEVDWIVMKALEKEPARRYQTAESLAADIRRFLNHEPIDAGPPSRVYALRKFVRRHRLPVAAAAAVVASLVALAAVAQVKERRAREAERVARAAGEEATRAADAERVAKDAARHSEQVALQRADDAARELSKANAIADFAETMLEGVGPSVARGRDTGILKDMLAAATAQSDERLAALPELDIVIRHLIAGAYQDLGDYPKAIELLRGRFDSMREGAFRDDPERLGAGLLLGTLYNNTGQGKLAADTFREVADGYERAGDNTSGNALQAQSAVAKALQLDGRDEEALAQYRRTLARLLELKRDEGEPVIEIRNAMAALLLHMDRVDEARQEWEALLPLARRLFGEEHPATIACTTNLAFVYASTGDYDRAIEFNRKVVDVARTIYEPNHPLRLPGLTNLVAALVQAGRLDEAHDPVEEAKQILVTNRDAVSWKTVAAFEQQSMLLRRRQARFDDALAHAEAMRDNYLRTFGPREAHTLAGEVYVLNAMVDADRPADAWAHVESLGVDPWPPGSENYLRMGWHASLAEILYTLGRLDEARAQMELAKSLADVQPDGSMEVTPRLQRVMRSFAQRAASQPTTGPATEPAGAAERAAVVKTPAGSPLRPSSDERPTP